MPLFSYATPLGKSSISNSSLLTLPASFASVVEVTTKRIPETAPVIKLNGVELLEFKVFPSPTRCPLRFLLSFIELEDK